ncbi:MAG TPA: type II toxin-antitoxin system RelE/ParE family toxin [Candidatus Obscuribacterales bacterium]
MIRITFAEEAGQDIEDIYAHIAEDNIAAADRHRERLRHRWEQLRQQPRLRRTRDDLKPGYRSITEGDYLILYQIVQMKKL